MRARRLNSSLRSNLLIVVAIIAFSRRLRPRFSGGANARQDFRPVDMRLRGGAHRLLPRIENRTGHVGSQMNKKSVLLLRLLCRSVCAAKGPQKRNVLFN